MFLRGFFRRFFGDPNFQRKKAFLRSLDLFKGLKNRELGQLVQSLHSRTYREGEILFLEGDIGRALFILESGSVELTKQDPSGKEQKIYTLKPGDFFGEMALLEQLPRTASARSLERSQLHLLYRSKLDALLHSYPRIGISILGHLAQILSARLRRSSQAVAADG
jgi:CRP-like cAMP-binding protein